MANLHRRYGVEDTWQGTWTHGKELRMQEHIDEKVDLYGDFFPFFQEEDMPETIPHAELLRYLVDVLNWLFHGQVCAICRNFAFFPPPEQPGPPVAPDIAVIKGVPLEPLSSWQISLNRPPPQVVFEVLSKETWNVVLPHYLSYFSLLSHAACS
jgi:hypothetical protein